MRQFRNIWFALTAFFWLPATAHCQLETIPGLEFLRCAEVAAVFHSADNDCHDCCAVEKLQYRADHARLAAPDPILLPLTFAPKPPALISLPVSGKRDFPTAAPPQLSGTWLFASRTAAPPRAPSLAS